MSSLVAEERSSLSLSPSLSLSLSLSLSVSLSSPSLSLSLSSESSCLRWKQIQRADFPDGVACRLKIDNRDIGVEEVAGDPPTEAPQKERSADPGRTGGPG